MNYVVSYIPKKVEGCTILNKEFLYQFGQQRVHDGIEKHDEVVSSRNIILW